jgi:uncharacterized coiled-coil protein SlyX
MDNSIIERFAKIESALAHLDRLYEQLNQVVTEQRRLLDKMQSQQERLSQSLSTIELDRVRSTNSKPPHYE